MKRYRAAVFISGAVTQYIYGTSTERLKARAIKLLTSHKPGFGALWPQRIEIAEKDYDIRGNWSQWKPPVITIPYKDITCQ